MKKGRLKVDERDPKSEDFCIRFFGCLSYVNGNLIHNHVERGRKWQERKRCCKEEEEGRKERPAEMASVANGSEREDRPSARQSLTVSFLKLFPCRWQPWRVILNEIFSSLDKTEGATSIFHLTSLFVYSGNQTGSLKTMNCQFLLKKSHCLAVYVHPTNLEWRSQPMSSRKDALLVFQVGLLRAESFSLYFKVGTKTRTILVLRPFALSGLARACFTSYSRVPLLCEAWKGGREGDAFASNAPLGSWGLLVEGNWWQKMLNVL